MNATIAADAGLNQQICPGDSAISMQQVGVVINGIGEQHHNKLLFIQTSLRYTQ
ncbi:MAG: hypothetical protein IPN88_14685 [Bacteroidetes bacterium]|nr:hypothetical protein [Bacteroidota bacterium]